MTVDALLEWLLFRCRALRARRLFGQVAALREAHDALVSCVSLLSGGTAVLERQRVAVWLRGRERTCGSASGRRALCEAAEAILMRRSALELGARSRPALFVVGARRA